MTTHGTGIGPSVELFPWGSSVWTTANISPSASSGASVWFRVTPMGKWTVHAQLSGGRFSRVMQVIDRDAVRAMVSAFKAGNTLPIYLGHPDDNPQAFPDARPHGSIVELAGAPDGLWARASLNANGREALAAGHRYPSARWALGKYCGQAGGVRPTRLISVGLTGNPNIPNRPIGQGQAPRAAANARHTFFAKVREIEAMEGSDFPQAYRRALYRHADLYKLAYE